MRSTTQQSTHDSPPSAGPGVGASGTARGGNVTDIIAIARRRLSHYAQDTRYHEKYDANYLEENSPQYADTTSARDSRHDRPGTSVATDSHLDPLT